MQRCSKNSSLARGLCPAWTPAKSGSKILCESPRLELGTHVSKLWCSQEWENKGIRNRKCSSHMSTVISTLLSVFHLDCRVGSGWGIALLRGQSTYKGISTVQCGEGAPESFTSLSVWLSYSPVSLHCTSVERKSLNIFAEWVKESVIALAKEFTTIPIVGTQNCPVTDYPEFPGLPPAILTILQLRVWYLNSATCRRDRVISVIQ